MPHALISIPDVYESVSRRVAVAVTTQLARIMRLPAETQVYLPGNSEAVPMNGGSFGDCADPGVRFPAEARLVVRFNEEVDENTTLTTQIAKPEHPPLFHDGKREIVFRPVYRYVTLTVTLEYNAPNVTLAQRWVDEMRSRISMGRAELYQDLEYHYALPVPVLHLLKHLHETREASEAPTGQSFEEYLVENLTVPTTIADTLTNTSPTRVVTEHQYEVLGWFDFTTTPPNPEAQEQGNYQSTITYTLHYNRPMQVYCRWPMMVHNKAIGKKYRPQVPYQSFRRLDRKVSTTKGSFDGLLELMRQDNIPYIQYPDVDDWVPDFVPKGRLTFFTGLLQITKADRTTLMDLANLGEFTFTPYFLEYFYQMGDRLFQGESVYEFRLYENNRLRNDIQLRMKPGTVTIETDEPLDLEKYYHLQISIVRNWVTLVPEQVEPLRRYPTVLYWTLRALGVNLARCDYTDLPLVGIGAPRYDNPNYPGEGSTLGDPANGGQWPWPWLGDEWGEIPWQGGDWESPYHTGVVKSTDLQEAIHTTDNKAGDPMDRIRVGPLTVLYGEIMTQKANAR
jgi:hypothetical protein